MPPDITPTKLIGISKAAKILGVHPLTLRNWTEQGHIAYYKTPGGHRRFKMEDLEAFLHKMNHRPVENNLVASTHKAVQLAIADRVQSHQNLPSLEYSSTMQKKDMRAIGRKLLGLTIQYVAGNAETHIVEAGREIGGQYGQVAKENGLSYHDIVATFNFFRDTIIEATFDSPSRTKRV